MMRSYLRDANGALESGLSRARMRTALEDERNLLWVDIEGPEDEEVELLLELFELHPLTVEDCIMPNARPKVEDFEHYLFVVLQGLTRDEGRLRATELDVCLGKNFLITVRSERVRAVEEASARVEKKSPIISRGADFLFYAIYESVIDSYFPVLDEMEARVDELEAKLLADASAARVRELLAVYHDLTALRRTLSPHREIASRLTRGEVLFIRPGNADYFRDISDHVLRMSDLVDGCREVTTMALEAHAMLVSNRLSGIVKTMTALATLAVPLILITGVYGMNFGENPELGPRWLYHALSAALLGSVPIMLYYFWKYRWL